MVRNFVEVYVFLVSSCRVDRRQRTGRGDTDNDLTLYAEVCMSLPLFVCLYPCHSSLEQPTRAPHSTLW